MLRFVTVIFKHRQKSILPIIYNNTVNEDIEDTFLS